MLLFYKIFSDQVPTSKQADICFFKKIKKNPFTLVYYGTSARYMTTSSFTLQVTDMPQNLHIMHQHLLAVSSPMRSMVFGCSSSAWPDKIKEGGLSCHEGLLRLEGRTGKKRIGSSVPFPLLPLAPPNRGVCCKHISNRSQNWGTVKMRNFDPYPPPPPHPHPKNKNFNIIQYSS